ncbi:MAG: nucleotidyl transferase AbiEii/AbiGii toxin family protein [Alcaligenaceae bacterium]|nr:nucleotidyl transferase AbiEii/AbiGii toxin family protein [Alcaligenaceae bacterium]
MRSRMLPEGPWEVLFSRAWDLLDDLRTIGGAEDPFWTFGGGTVLMFRHDHRASKDIDIFVADPQYLGYLTPRLSDKAAEMTSQYVEDASSYVKLQFEEGEIDFVAAPNLLDDAWEWWDILGHRVRVERSAEIIAKKMYHRGNQATARDLFDLCLVIEREPDALQEAAPFLIRHRDAFLERIRLPSMVLCAGFDAIDTRAYTPSFEQCIAVASDYLESL